MPTITPNPHRADTSTPAGAGLLHTGLHFLRRGGDGEYVASEFDSQVGDRTSLQRQQKVPGPKGCLTQGL